METNEVEHFIYQQQEDQRELLLYFHNLLVDRFQLSPKIRYKIPFYFKKSWVCYLNPKNHGGLDFAIIRANELDNNHAILEQKDRKQIATIEILPDMEIPESDIIEIINEALELDDRVPCSLKRKKK